MPKNTAVKPRLFVAPRRPRMNNQGSPRSTSQPTSDGFIQVPFDFDSLPDEDDAEDTRVTVASRSARPPDSP